MAVELLQFITLLSALLYAGASLYTSFIEHPARLQCGPATAARVFAPSYRRGIWWLYLLVLLATIGSLGVWSYLDDARWFIGSIAIFVVIPFTILTITPLLGELLRPDLDAASAHVEALLVRWGWLNMVRSVLGLFASCLFLYATVAP
jgi:hypothetical protein